MWRTALAGPGTVVVVLALIVAAAAAGRASAQAPTIEPGLPAAPGSDAPALGPSPGAAGSALGSVPGTEQTTIGGSAGRLTPKVPPSISVPGTTSVTPPPVGAARAPSVPESELPIYGSLALPSGPEAAGPPQGLSLDEIITILISDNLDLRAKFYEIPLAEADILTASLRANPIFYADAQLVPYGNYSDDRPGGQTQYDVNLSIPLDLNGKRQARMVVAAQAKRVIEAQYQDAVRLAIDDVYTAFVDLLAARETVRFAEASVRGFEESLKPLIRSEEQGAIAEADVNRVRAQRDLARIGLAGAQTTVSRAKQALATLLNLPPHQADRLEVRGSLHDAFPPPPGEAELTRIALEGRPDLAAFRLGVQRATADVRLARANQFADVYWLVQPYTFQNNAPIGRKSATSWAMGVTVPLPLMNRNQGNIRRAELNVTQTQIQLAALERQVVTEVLNALRDYSATRQAVAHVEADVLPKARQVYETMALRHEKGETDILALLVAQREFNDTVRQYRDILVRHRRSMLELNTAVGRRLLP